MSNVMLHVVSTIAAFGFKDQDEFDSILPRLEQRGYSLLIKGILDRGWDLSKGVGSYYRKEVILPGDRFRTMYRNDVIGEILYANNSIHFLLPSSASSTFAITLAKGDAQAAHDSFANDIEAIVRNTL